MKTKLNLINIVIATSFMTACGTLPTGVTKDVAHVRLSYGEILSLTESLARSIGDYKRKMGVFPKDSSFLGGAGNSDRVLYYHEKQPPGTYCFLPENFLKDPRGGGTSIIAFTTDSIKSKSGMRGRFAIESNLMVTLYGEAAFNLLLNPHLEKTD